MVCWRSTWKTFIPHSIKILHFVRFVEVFLCTFCGLASAQTVNIRDEEMLLIILCPLLLSEVLKTSVCGVENKKRMRLSVSSETTSHQSCSFWIVTVFFRVFTQISFAFLLPCKLLISSKWKLWEKEDAFIPLLSSNYESTAPKVSMTSERFSSAFACAVSHSPLQADSQWRFPVVFIFFLQEHSQMIPLVSVTDFFHWSPRLSRHGGGRTIAYMCVFMCVKIVFWNVTERDLCHTGDRF